MIRTHDINEVFLSLDGVEIPILHAWCTYEYYNAIPAQREAGGTIISPAEPAKVEIQGVYVLFRGQSTVRLEADREYIERLEHDILESLEQ